MEFIACKSIQQKILKEFDRAEGHETETWI